MILIIIIVIYESKMMVLVNYLLSSYVHIQRQCNAKLLLYVYDMMTVLTIFNNNLIN